MRPAQLTLAAALLAAGCSDGTETPATQETVAAVPETGAAPTGSSAPQSGNADRSASPADSLGSDRVMQGSWTSKAMAGHPAVLFGEPQTEAAFLIRCEEGELALARELRRPAGTVTMALMAGGKTRTIEATSRPDPLPTITGRLDASDTFAAELMTTHEPIAVRIGDGPSFRMPASEAMRRLVADCRG